MKNFDFAHTITVLANVGVVAGIVFLIFELQQNNELMEAEARATHASMTQTGWGYIIENPDFIDVLIKDRNEETTIRIHPSEIRGTEKGLDRDRPGKTTSMSDS